ncbi:MAG: PspC domain-containing protein [Nocardioides sp.]
MTTPQQAPQPGPAPKRLVRTSDDKWLSGVCGGVGRYAGIDANLVRLLVVIAALVSCGTALIAYVVAWVLMPEE